MASSSTSSIQNSFTYDVFLSFRGEDTRRTFVDHLHRALVQKSIVTFKDDERIEKGERISNQLIRSIEDSRFYIIVFSKNYASSSWCLDELLKIMEYQRMAEHTAFPVFYDVEPTEIRKQIGSVGEAFAKHEKEEAAEDWRDAMKEAANLAGWELKNTFDGHEAKLIQDIVEKISVELFCINWSIDERLVGMEDRLKDVVSYLRIGTNDVRVIGIKGIGGGGKTTLARVVFDHISISFEASSFVENVREVSNDSSYGLRTLQKQILSDVSNDKEISVPSVFDGQNKLKRMMRGKRVLVVLDDVDHIDQLEALAGDPNWFKPGSRIIITTRDEQVLVSYKTDTIHDVNLLSDKEATCLFSRYVFRKDVPIQGYEELSKKVVSYAAGLPLAIKVLGSSLYGKSQGIWVDTLERPKTILLKETLQKLELSYISLEDDYKEMFLDVVCLLKGFEEEVAIRVLESCGFPAKSGLKVLEQKSLVTISKHGYLGMHDHIEEMGKNIVRRLYPNEPWKHSRLWIKEEIEDILSKDLGGEATRGLMLQKWQLYPDIVMKGLRKMKKLRFLFLYGYSGKNWASYESMQYLPHGLQSLHWYDYPFTCLPKKFHVDNLVELQMSYSNITQLWEARERKVLNKIRFINLSCSKLRVLDLGPTPNLEILHLAHCKDLIELHMPGERPMLKSLNLSNSTLRALDLGPTPNLETLHLAQCKDQEELRMPGERPMLKSLNLSNSKLRNLDLGPTPSLEPSHLEYCKHLRSSLNVSNSRLRAFDLGPTPNIETILHLVHSKDQVELRMDGEMLMLKSLDLSNSKLRVLVHGPTPNLETLHLVNCKDLIELHMPGERPMLKSLDLSSSMVRALYLGSTPNLEKLHLVHCKDLVKLHMPGERLMLRSLDLSNSKLRDLDLGPTPNLETLHLVCCEDLVELHIPGERPMLKSIDLSSSKLRTLDLGSTPNLQTLHLVNCKDLVELCMPNERPMLKSLDLSNSKLRVLELGPTPNLETLHLVHCEDLVELHMPGERPMLKSIDLSSSKLRTLDLGPTPNLHTLHLVNCKDLVELCMPNERPMLKSLDLSNSKLSVLVLGPTPNLETLHLVHCEDLVELHMPGERPMLKSIDLSSSMLRTLDLGTTPNLETLHLVNCKDLVELCMPGERPMLKSLDLSNSKLRDLDLGPTPNLETLHLVNCEDLVELYMPGERPMLKSLDFSNSKLRVLELGPTPNLEKLL